MFQSARIKLTLFYLLIIMVISVAFSGFVYRSFMIDAERGLRRRAVRVQAPGSPFVFIQPDPDFSFETQIEVLNELRQQLLTRLVFINLIIVGCAGSAGYFLAGKTLAPIEKMVDDQKRFIGDASHELRTPLTALRTEIEVALLDPKLSKDEAKKLLKSNLEEVDKMQSLSNYLLALSKYENSNQKITKEKIDLSREVKKATNRVNLIAQEKGITIKENLNEVFIHANATSITELATILLDNAVKYSDHGKQVTVKTYAKGKQAVLEVKDQGIGINASNLPFIFNRFYRADTSRSKTKVDGHGLGLSIAKSIADMHKATIHVESTPGKGSVFTVNFQRFIS